MTKVVVSDTTYTVTVADDNYTVKVQDTTEKVTVEISNSAADVQTISGGTGSSLIASTVGAITTLKSVSAGSNVTFSDDGNTITISATEDDLSNNTTDNLAEGTTNLYYTDDRVNTRTRAYLQGEHNADIYPDTSGTRSLGSSARNYDNVWADNLRIDTIETVSGTGDISIKNSLVPDTDDAYDLGSTTSKWRSLYLSRGSLYIEGQKIIGGDGDGNIDITTDAGENLHISSGADVIIQPQANASNQNFTVNIDDIQLGTVGSTGTVAVRGTLEAPDTHVGDLELSATLIDQTATDQNLEIRTNGTGHLFANVADYYVGTLTQAAHITGTEIKHVGERLDIEGELFGAIEFKAKNTEGSALSKGDPVYIKGHSGNTTEVGKADANTSAKMPAFGIAAEDINNNNKGDIVTYGVLRGFDTSAFSVGDELYVSNTGTLTATRPTSSADAVQKIAKVIRSHAQNGMLFVMGAGRTNDIPNLSSGEVFIGDGSGYETRALTTSDVSEGTNLYYTDARADARAQLKIDALIDGAPAALDTLNEIAAAINDDADVYNTLNGLISTNATNIALKYDAADFNTDWDTRLATKDTDDLSEGTSNLYYTQARFNTAFTAKDTDDLSEGTTNQYHTTARARGAISASGSLSYNSTTGVISYTQPTNVSTFTNDSGYITDYTVTEGDVTAHQAALSITESQISDLQSYLTGITGESVFDLSDVSGTHGAGKLLVNTGSGFAASNVDTDDFVEGTTNLFHTDARAISAIEGASALDITGDFTVEGSNNNSVEIGDSQLAGTYDISTVKIVADENRWASITLKEYEGGANKPFASGFLNPTFGSEIIGGTFASPAAVSSGKRLFMLQALAANQSDGTLPASANFRIKAETTQAQTTANRGTKVEIETTPDDANSTTTSLAIQGSTLTLHPDGNGTIKTGGDLIIEDDLVVDYSLHVKTTADFDGDVNMDGNLQVDGTLTVDGNATLGNANTDTITSTGKLVTSNGLTLTNLNTSTANYLAGLGVVDTGGIAYITDGNQGDACIGVYDGSNWKVVSLGGNISST